jgi:hypothetical protein
MSMNSATVSFIGNNQNLINLISKSFRKKNITTKDFDTSQSSNYLIFIIKPNQNFEIFEIEKYLSKINPQTKIAVIFQVSQLDNQILNHSRLTKISENLFKKNLDIRILLTYDIVDSHEKFHLSVLDQLIKDSIYKQFINISRNGNLKLFPLAFSDFIEGLSRSLFLSNTSNQIYYLAGSSVSDIDFALNLKRDLAQNNLSLEINQNLNPQSSQLDPETHIDSTSATLNWFPVQDIDALISEMIASQKTSIDNPSSIDKSNLKRPSLKISIPPKLKNFQTPSFLHLFLILIGTSVSLYLIVFVVFFYFFTTSLTNAKLAYDALRQGDLDQSIKLTESSSRKSNIAENLYELSSSPIQLFNPNLNDTIHYLISTLNHTNELIRGFHRIYSIGNGFYQDSLSGVDIDIKNISSVLINQLESFQTELNQLLLINQPNYVNNIGFLNTKLPENLKTENINLLKSQVSQAISLAKILPVIFPEDKMVHYLVLIQDNNELRPSGGFLNTYALLSFQKNRLIDLKIDSTLRLDSQLLGQIEPPQNIATLTGNPHWNFSDSNYSPFFPETAKQIAWFYEKITGQKIDGVINLNLSFFEKYLKYYQPLTLNNQEFNSDNLRLILANPTQNDSENDLTKITQTIFNDIKSNRTPLATLARTFLDTTADGDINLWLADDNSENLINTTNLSGIIKNLPCPPQFINSPCLPETFYFNESNYSINKSNYYSKRHLEHIINLDNDRITHQIIVNYSYPNPVPKTGNLQYQALIYLYAPSGVNLTEVTLDDQILDKETIFIVNKYGLTQIEFPIKFNLNQNHRLAINLQSNQKISINGNLTSYSLNLYKQPGINNTTTQVIINYPETLSPKILSQPAESLRQKLIFSTKPSSTSTYAVAFSSGYR